MDLPNEIIAIIFGYCDIHSQLNLRLVNKQLSFFLKYIHIDKQIRVSNDDINQFYFHLLTNIIIDYFLEEYPRYLTHLTFGHYFNQNIKDCIPASVTHLTFGDCFNQNIKDCIPASVTHLAFGDCFNQDIKDCVPSGVTHIAFGFWFNQDIKDCIPVNVIHLTFGLCFNLGFLEDKN